MKNKFPLELRLIFKACKMLSLMVVIIFLCHFSAFAQVHLVKDINQYQTGDPSEYASLTDVNGVLYFKSKNEELWKSDGTTAGSVKIKTFEHIYDLKKVGDQLFFFASDTSNTSTLWKTDGTTAGTVEVSPKIVTGSYMTDVNGLLFFIGNTVLTGLEIWRSDGTAAGTFIVKDIMKGGGNSNPTSLVSFNGRLFFVASNGINGYEIWTSDGTTAGTQIFKDIIPGKTGSTPNYLTTANNTLFFMARDAALGEELWKTDGTPEGTVLVKDIFPGSKSSFPTKLISAENILYFRADDGVHKFQLWRSDGTDAGTIELTTSGFDRLNGEITSGSYLYYLLGDRVYRTDGTIAGTQFIINIENYFSVKDMAELNGSVYVVSETKKLWKITGTTATVIAQVGSDPSVSSNLTKVGNYIYYEGNGDNTAAFTLWKSDGTTAGTTSILDIDQATGGSYPYNLTDFNGTLFFNATPFRTEMWKSDGTEAGTVSFFSSPFRKAKTFNGDLFFSTAQSLSKTDGNTISTISTQFTDASVLSVVNGTLFFAANNPTSGIELCKTDGTEAGTVLVKDIYPGGTWSGNPDYITEFNGQAFFSARDASHGVELWKSDGTESGTVLVKDIIPGIFSSAPSKLVTYNNQLFFFVFRSGVGYELWKSDGTESGTVFFKQATPNSAVPEGDLMVSNGVLYFGGADSNGTSLWKTDGTPAGTVKVSDFFPGYETIYLLATYNNNLYMLIKASSNFELWKTDGTTAGTIMVKKIGVDNSTYPTSEIHNGYLYINVSNKTDNNAIYENEVWRTDGTSCGTFRVDYQSNVLELRHSGSTLFAAGKSGLSGFELLSIEDSEIVPLPCNEREALADVSNNDQEFGSYPNPFNRTFSVRMNGKQDATFSMKALNMSGVQVEHQRDLKTNTSYEMGAEWSAGLYVLRIEMEGKYVTKKILKQGN